MKRLSIALAAAAGAFALSVPAMAQQQQARPSAPIQPPEAIEPARVWVNTAVMTGTVTGIDRAERRIMARDERGRVMTLAVGPEVNNFENLRQGDQVTLRYTEAEAVALAKQTDQRQDWGEIRSRVESTASAQAPAGASRPGMGSVEQTTVVANVFDIDRQRGILTLRGTSGEPVDIMASPKALEQIDRNDQIAISYIEATAVEISPEGRGMAAAEAAGGSRDAGR